MGITTVMTAAAFTSYVVSYREVKSFLGPVLGYDTAQNYVASGVISEVHF